MMLRHPSRPRSRRVSIALAALAIVGMAAPAAVTEAASASVKKTKPRKWPIGGQVSMGVSAGAGTFVSGEQNRPSVTSSMSLFFGAGLGGGLRLNVLQSINKTLVDFAEDPFAARKRNTTLGDTMLILAYRPMVAGGRKKELTAAEKAAIALNPSLAAGDSGRPLKLPGGIGVQGILRLHLPTSKIAQHQTRQATVGAALTFNKGGIGPFSFIYQVRFDKNFHKYSNAVVNYDELNTTPLARPGGEEQVGSSLVATRFNNPSYAFRNLFIASINTGTKLSFQIVYLLINQFRYYDAPLDEYSSPHAKGGRGRLDLAWGQIAALYSLGGGYMISANTATFTTPWSADNQSLRLPFLEFRNASDNITSFGLSLLKNF